MVHHGIDINRPTRDAVIDEEREDPGKHAVKPEELAVVAMAKEQRFDVRADGIQEIIADTRFLVLVEKVAVEEILLGLGEDLDFHAVRSLSSFLTWFQSS